MRHPKTFHLHIKLRGWLILAILVLLAGWLGSLAWHAVGLLDAARKGEAFVEGAQGMSRQSLAGAGGWIRRADTHLSGLRWGLAPLFPLLDVAGLLPGVGRYAGQVEPLLVYGSELAHAGNLAYQGFAPLFEEDASPAGAPLSAQAVQVLAANRDTFRAAREAVDRAAIARARLNLDLVPGKIGEQLRNLDLRFPLLQGGLALLDTLPELAGAQGGEKTYLLLAENSDELRGSGGFISSFGWVKLSGGVLRDFQVQDSYSVDNLAAGYPPPPEPIRRFMLAGYWVPRDANWSPDFPAAAQQAQMLYAMSTGQLDQGRTPFAGVIAFDQQAVAALLEPLGPVSLVGIDQPVNTANAVQWMQQSWAPEPGQGVTAEWWAKRKDFISLLGSAMLSRLVETRDPGLLFAVGKTVIEQAHRGRIQFYINQPDAQSALVSAGLDGGVKPGDGDFLMLVDSNLGFNKVDPLIQRSLAYQVDLRDPAQPNASLAAGYRSTVPAGEECKHTATYGNTYADLQKRCYWDFWRLLVPAGSRLTSSQVKAVPAERLLSGQAWDGEVGQEAGAGGALEISGMMVLPGGEAQENRLEWNLPAGVLVDQDGRLVYRLRVQKQAGSAATELAVTVIAPAEYRLVEGGSDWQAAGEGAYLWKGSLDESLDFRLVFTAR